MSKTSQQVMTGRPENTKGVSRRGFMIGATSAGFTLASDHLEIECFCTDCDVLE